MNMERKSQISINRQYPGQQQSFYGLATSKLTRLAVCLLFISRLLALGLAGVFLIAGAAAQSPAAAASNEQKAKCDNQIRSTYLLGPDDQLEISGPELLLSATWRTLAGEEMTDSKWHEASLQGFMVDFPASGRIISIRVDRAAKRCDFLVSPTEDEL